MERWQLSGIITNDTNSKLVIPDKYLWQHKKSGILDWMIRVLRQGAKQISKITIV